MTTLDTASPPDPKVLDAFEREGFVVLRDVITPEWREQAAAAAMLLLASDRPLGRDRSVDGKDGFRGIVAMDDTFLPLVTNPKVLPTLVALLSANLHLMSSNLIYMPSIPPGDKRTIRVPERHGWHRDMSSATRDLGTDLVPRMSIKAAYFLSDLTPDAGVTMVLPGSHTDTGPVTVPAGAIDPPGAITPDVGPCDAFLFENRTWHAGGLNTSGHPRLAVMMQYGYRWLAPVDDPAPQLLDRGDLTDIEQQLLGRPDRNPDGSVTHEGAGAAPLRAWWQHLTADPGRSPE
ncbi:MULTISPECIES: phytanoyl-CoA dioxygenase family protein [Streptomyces]|uniref:Phytanoyl-CoA dioxygenase n=1 Tax=Streptomyces dengpaensis TaxID=2049881 RepID=A0ABM6SLW8_9ACTN|nr:MULTISPECIES: phytanoyl-CoA dioxygenase family protein [Streptomyces]AVH55592.1 phytanoyl-CoA dioxygenase [Streptomyces dengpaensis]PIB11855.1 phytanoyl-CoA dioxygenase [Streptomyces sp. HG99]